MFQGAEKAYIGENSGILEGMQGGVHKKNDWFYVLKSGWLKKYK